MPSNAVSGFVKYGNFCPGKYWTVPATKTFVIRFAGGGLVGSGPALAADVDDRESAAVGDDAEALSTCRAHTSRRCRRPCRLRQCQTRSGRQADAANDDDDADGRVDEASGGFIRFARRK